MGERLRVHLPLGFLLDPVVADRGSGVEAVVDVQLRQVDDKPCLDRVRGPDARVAVRLELRADGAALRPLRVVSDPVEHAEHVLHVVAVLVRDHVGLDERRVLRAELLQLVEEAEVDVDELVRWAVERADLGAGGAAARVDLVGEEDGVDVLVLLPAPREDLVPELLDAVHDGDDAAVLALVRVLARLALLRDL